MKFNSIQFKLFILFLAFNFSGCITKGKTGSYNSNSVSSYAAPHNSYKTSSSSQVCTDGRANINNISKSCSNGNCKYSGVKILCNNRSCKSCDANNRCKSILYNGTTSISGGSIST